jgi:quercetin dioxygenase-like cupin family protein
MPDDVLAADPVEWLGVTYRTLLSSDATGGAMSITDSVSPSGSGPPRHIHHGEDETFVILSGECEFWVAGETFRRREGETAFVPRGTEHTFRVVGDQLSRHLLILTPGGFEGFFVEMARGRYRIPDDMEQIVECAARYGLSFTGPPLNA